MELEFSIILFVAITVLGTALGIAWRDTQRDVRKTAPRRGKAVNFFATADRQTDG